MRILGCVFLLFVALTIFPSIAQSKGLFSDEEMLKEEMRNSQVRQKLLQTSIKGIDLLKVLMAFEEFKKGNCSGLADWEKKAKQGIANYQYHLTDLYHLGFCFKKNDVLALHWLKKAANQKHVAAQRDLGIYYLKGQGAKKDLNLAANWLLKAAKNGSVNAQSEIASMYRVGKGVLQNTRKALHWYKRAFLGRKWDAAVSIALIYIDEFNRASKTNNLTDKANARNKAREWALKGAERGDHIGQLLMGYVERGDWGGERNIVEAHKWGNLASLSLKLTIKKDAQKLRTQLAKSMSSSQSAKAERLASIWKPRTDPAPGTTSDNTKKIVLPKLTGHLLKERSPDKAKSALVKLGVPITRKTFFAAVKQDNLEVFKLFQVAGADLETPDSLRYGLTPLYVAVNFESRRIFRYLMDRKVNINVVNGGSGHTPLVRAIAHGLWDMADALLRAGADAQMKKPIYGAGLLPSSPLVYALMYDRPEFTRKLIQAGASVTERYSFRNTPLHNAARGKSPGNVKLLLKLGADPKAVNKWAQTPVHAALKHPRDIRILELILKAGGPASGKENFSQYSPLFMAVHSGRSDVVELLLKHGAKVNEIIRLGVGHIPMSISDKFQRELLMVGCTPLMLAAALGHVSVVEILVKNGADKARSIAIEKQMLTASDIARKTGNPAITQIIQGR